MPTSVTVHASFDAEAAVWFITDSTLAGLSGEADTLEALVDRLPGLVADLLDENGFEDGAEGRDVPIEVVAHRTTSVHYSSAA